MINYFVPVIVVIIIIYGIYKKVDIFDTFLVGVKEGMKVSINLFPTIFAMIIAVTMLTSSGIITNISNLLSIFFDKINFPVEVLPLAILRPISGSSSLAILSDIFARYGPDSFIGKVASVMYFGSIGIKKIKYSLVVGLLADLISIILSIVMVRLFFG